MSKSHAGLAGGEKRKGKNWRVEELWMKPSGSDTKRLRGYKKIFLKIRFHGNLYHFLSNHRLYMFIIINFTKSKLIRILIT